MKFKDIINFYLLTEGRTKEITEDLALEAVRNNCSEFTSDPEPKLWRGVQASYSYGIIRPSNHIRRSKDNAGLYTTVLSASPNWASYPNRKRSLITIPRERSTMQFGSPYVVIPFNGAKFAMAQEADIWDSLLRAINISVRDFQGFLASLIHEKYSDLNKSSREIYADYNLIKKYFTGLSLEDVYEHVPEVLFRREIRKIRRKWSKYNPKDMFDLIEKLHTPENLGVKLVDYDKIPFNSKNEVWTESPCVLVEKERIKTFIKNL